MAFIQPIDGPRIISDHAVCFYRHHQHGLFMSTLLMPTMFRVDGVDRSAPEPLLALNFDELTDPRSMEAVFEYTLNKRVLNADYFLQMTKMNYPAMYPDLLTTMLGVRRDEEVPVRDTKANALIAQYDLLPPTSMAERHQLLRAFWRETFMSGLEMALEQRGGGFADLATRPAMQALAAERGAYAAQVRSDMEAVIAGSDPTTRVLIGTIAPLIVVSDRPLEIISGFEGRSDAPKKMNAAYGMVQLFRDRVLLRHDKLREAWPEEASHLVTERLGYIGPDDTVQKVKAFCKEPRYEKARKTLMEEAAKVGKSSYFIDLPNRATDLFLVGEVIEAIEQIARGHMQTAIASRPNKFTSEQLFSKIRPQMKQFGDMWDLVRDIIENKHRAAFNTVMRKQGVDEAIAFADSIGFKVPHGQWQKELAAHQAGGTTQQRPRQ